MGNSSITDRHAVILEKLLDGPITVPDIALLTQVSEITIRRDLAELEQLGYLKRTHGGAVSINSRTMVVPFALRELRNQPAKQRIARYATNMIADGECVALDSGSTILEMTEHMERFNVLTVLTVSVFNAMRLMKNPKIRVVLPGGVMEGMEGILTGELTVRALEGFNMDKFFLCVGAVDVTSGLTDHGLEDAQMKTILISRAKEVILLADSSKFGVVAFKNVCYFDAVDKLITDAIPPQKVLEALKAAHVEVHVVGEDSVTVL